MCGVYSRAIPPCNRMGEASQRPLHFLTKRRHLRKKIRPKVHFLSGFFQFGVFLLQLFFLATEPVSSETELTRATKRKKKPRKGHNELKPVFPTALLRQSRAERPFSARAPFQHIFKLPEDGDMRQRHKRTP